MRRTTARLHLYNTMLAPGLITRRDVDRVFEAIRRKAAAANGGVALTDADQTDLADLKTLLGCFAAIEGLSGVGWRSAQDLVKSRIENRYRIRGLQAKHPKILDEPVNRPIFVVGLPRTATTLTHKILARADGCRGPKLWEMYNLGLAVDDATRARQIKQTQKRVDMTLQISPDWNIIHPVDADGEEEDYFVKDHTALHCAVAPIWDYLDFLTEHDFSADYRLLKEALQVLSYERPRARWVIKHPGNLFSIASIREVFPDADIVWTHRDPSTVMGSMCSMAESLHRLHIKPGAVDLADIGRMWLRILSEGVAGARDQRTTIDRAAIHDVGYHWLMSDPHTYVPELFAELDLPWTGRDRSRLEAALSRPIDRRLHEYTLGRYGLDHATIEQAFGDYVEFVTGLNQHRR
ncbi:sulfotransferase [Glycomyces sp. L485]|uniref:sulfotransferase family protein n=1 Tax=Glycomyces sp. L485 TaxID=2909235 RepID=UPI001F4B2021|nr:sulfotransferase [Glycomyces sp. L485]MCH7231503.1 sulfotransferase [Glycomyces sp. L485]